MDPNIKVKVDGHIFHGSIRLRAKICKRPNDISEYAKSCFFTKKEMMTEEEDEKTYDNEGEEDEIPNQSLCSPNEFL